MSEQSEDRKFNKPYAVEELLAGRGIHPAWSGVIVDYITNLEEKVQKYEIDKETK